MPHISPFRSWGQDEVRKSAPWRENDDQGDDCEKPASTKSGGKTSLMALHKNSRTFKNRRWSSPGLAVYAARRPSFAPVGGQV